MSISREQLRKGALGTLAGVFFVVAGVNFWRTYGRSPVDEELDRRADYICTVCGLTWHTTFRYAVANSEVMGKCPECDDWTAARALNCPDCGKTIPKLGHSTYPPSCMHCGVRFYEPESCGMDVETVLRLQADAEAMARPTEVPADRGS